MLSSYGGIFVCNFSFCLGFGQDGWVWGREKQRRKLFKGTKEAQTEQPKETATRRFQLRNKETSKGFSDSLSLSLFM
jgi:Flp pilus assembly protein TadB